MFVSLFFFPVFVLVILEYYQIKAFAVYYVIFCLHVCKCEFALIKEPQQRKIAHKDLLVFSFIMRLHASFCKLNICMEIILVPISVPVCNILK